MHIFMATKLIKMHCPNCSSCKIKKNGFTHYRKQNFKCLECARQFVNSSDHYISQSKRALIAKALVERVSLRGICRIFEVSLTWLLKFMVQTYNEAPKDLGAKLPLKASAKNLKIIGLQIDEAWSFVQSKANVCWIWVVLNPHNNQVICFHIGSRGADCAKALWKKIPRRLRKYCDFYSDDLNSYKSVLPKSQHYIGKSYTQHIERFFCTMRHRVSRLVRDNLAFSKKKENHELALRYYFWKYNIAQAALHV